jgi:hypothetical protein
MSRRPRLTPVSAAAVFLALACASLSAVAAEPARDDAGAAEVGFAARAGEIDVMLGGRAVATYVFDDAKTMRPFFKDVKTPSGVQVTRNRPPVAGKDAVDHPDMHPGLWLAFGDVSGNDFWRNKGPRVEHERFSEPPRGGAGRGTFEVVNRYVAGGSTLCRETTRYTVLVRPSGYLILWDSTFAPAGEAAVEFGSQEEMGLGVRVATPIAVKGGGGTITNSLGGVNEKGTWGQAAEWCDYSGIVDGRRVGVALMTDPAGESKPWFHSRDYGLLVANPSGPRANAPARIRVRPDTPHRLRFGVLVHESPQQPGAENIMATEYQSFVKLLESDAAGAAAPPRDNWGVFVSAPKE